MTTALFVKDVEDRGLPDPAGKGVEETRDIREEIYERALGLLLEMPEAAGHRELLTKPLQDCE